MRHKQPSSRRRLAAAFLFFLATCVASAEPTASGAGLDDLAFMAGSWGGSSGGVESEEVWTAPKAGLMLGVHRDVMASGRAAFEYLRIEQDAEGIVYRASPQGRSDTAFRLVEVSPGRAVFENPDHDFPNKIVYWLESDQLCARVEGEVGGETRSMQWRWDRMPIPETTPAGPPARRSTPR